MRVELIKEGDSVIKVTEDTQYVLDFSGLSKKDSISFETTLLFEVPGITAELLGLYVVPEGKTVNLETSAEHVATNTSCNQVIKAGLLSNSTSKYKGKIIIKEGAQQTSSFLDDGVLVLGENVHNSSDPILEISANEVSASHGATTGKVSPMQIYYLQSRGLDSKVAQDLIAHGFLKSGIDKIKDDKIKSEVLQWINEQL